MLSLCTWRYLYAGAARVVSIVGSVIPDSPSRSSTVHEHDLSTKPGAHVMTTHRVPLLALPVTNTRNIGNHASGTRAHARIARDVQSSAAGSSAWRISDDELGRSTVTETAAEGHSKREQGVFSMRHRAASGAGSGCRSPGGSVTSVDLLPSLPDGDVLSDSGFSARCDSFRHVSTPVLPF